MSWAQILDLAGAISLLLGAGLALVGAIGLVRLPDLFARMHAATKPQTLGLLLILLGLALTVASAVAVVTAAASGLVWGRVLGRLPGGRGGTGSPLSRACS